MTWTCRVILRWTRRVYHLSIIRCERDSFDSHASPWSFRRFARVNTRSSLLTAKETWCAEALSWNRYKLLLPLLSAALRSYLICAHLSSYILVSDRWTYCILSIQPAIFGDGRPLFFYPPPNHLLFVTQIERPPYRDCLYYGVARLRKVGNIYTQKGGLVEPAPSTIGGHWVAVLGIAVSVPGRLGRFFFVVMFLCELYLFPLLLRKGC